MALHAACCVCFEGAASPNEGGNALGKRPALAMAAGAPAAWRALHKAAGSSRLCRECTRLTAVAAWGPTKALPRLVQGAVPGGTSHRQMAMRYLAAHEGVRKLRDNMREEHILVLDFVSTIFKHVSNTLSAVRCTLVNSYRT